MNMQENDNIKFMQRCLDLAGMAEGMTFPNPVVGSVIVHDDLIIGEGYHIKPGEPHAEIIAIASVKDKRLLTTSVLYVNLEPCSHFGKTPPCADMIISQGIKKIVIGTKDTSKKVSGNGIEKLKKAGCEVITGVLEEKCRFINRRFFTFHERGRPYIILKWAQSADGYLDAERKRNLINVPARISGNPEKILVHKWRADEQSILVGAGTVRADNPKLNIREWTGKDPLRLILSSSGQIEKDSEIFRTNGINIVFTHNADAKFADAAIVKLNGDRESASQITDYLYNEGIQSLLIEGGAIVLNHFISNNLWDEARIFSGKEFLKGGIKAPDISGKIISQAKFQKSSLKVILNEAF